jgi:hypothetical protein
VTIVGHYSRLNSLTDFLHDSSVKANVTQEFLNSVPKKQDYVLPHDHRCRIYNPVLTARDIQRTMSKKIPLTDKDHLEMLQLYDDLIGEFESVVSIKQASFLPNGDFETHFSVFDKSSLFYLLRDCEVPAIRPYDRDTMPSYDTMLRMILTRYYQ